MYESTTERRLMHQAETTGINEYLALNARLNDLLAGWHAWSAGHVMEIGYQRTCPTFRQARASRQYDDANGSLDAHVDAVLMEAVDAVVSAIDNPWHAALSVQARNLHTGRSVWASPRLPACPTERAKLLGVARNKFAQGLEKAGILW